MAQAERLVPVIFSVNLNIPSIHEAAIHTKTLARFAVVWAFGGALQHDPAHTYCSSQHHVTLYIPRLRPFCKHTVTSKLTSFLMFANTAQKCV